MTDGDALRRFAERDEVAEPANGLVLRGLLGVEDSDADLSITWVRIDGRHRRLRTDAGTRVYVVLAGSGTFTLGDEPAVEAGEGDTVVVARGTPYELAGTMTYLVINQPGFRDGDDVYLEL